MNSYPQTDRSRGVADWLHRPEEQEGLGRYLETIRERLWLIIITTLIATGAAVAYVVTAEKVYEGQADLLVTPVSSSGADAPLLPGLPLIRESADPTRDVETASRLVTSTDVADRVRRELDIAESSQELLGDVTAEPVADSNLVSVAAQAGSPEQARDLANAFAEQAVVEQTDALHAEIDRRLPELRRQARNEQAGAAASPSSSSAVLGQLESLRSGPNPTMSVDSLARAPESQVSPRPLLSIIGGAFAGLVIGLAAAFAWQGLDPRLRREEQLRRQFRLPVLARIPNSKSLGGRPLSPMDVSAPTAEAYRTLRGALSASRQVIGKRSSTILVTGSSPSEGKTTTSINLATSLAAAGNHVILIEADLRRPSIGEALDVRPADGVVSVLTESAELEDALVTSPDFGTNVGFLLADYEGGWITDLFALPAAREMLDEAKRLADYVVIDSPPVNEVVDALPLATYADDVVIVTRIGRTHLRKLMQLAEMLAEHKIKPAGFAVVGAPGPERGDYVYFASGERTKRALADEVLKSGHS